MKNTLLIIGIIIIILLAIGGYLYMNKSQSPLSMTGKEKKIEETTQGSAMKSLRELMMMGQDQMCTFESTDDNGSNKGSSYISGEKVRTDFSGTDPDGKAYSGSMISDGTYMYTWSSAGPQGMKIKINEETNQEVEDIKKDVQKSQDQFVNPDEKIDYRCQGWRADQSMFTPPSDIEFVDYSQPMEQTQEQTDAVKEFQCAGCDSLTGDEQTACKSALGC